MFLLKENSDFESFARNSVSDSAVCFIPDLDKKGALNSLETAFKRGLGEFCKILVLKDVNDVEKIYKNEIKKEFGKFVDGCGNYVHFLKLNENSSLERFVKFVETMVLKQKRKSFQCC